MPTPTAACSVPWLIILGYMDRLFRSSIDAYTSDWPAIGKIWSALQALDRTVSEEIKDPDILEQQFFKEVQNELEFIEDGISKDGKSAAWVLEHLETLRLGAVEKAKLYYANKAADEKG